VFENHLLNGLNTATSRGELKWVESVATATHITLLLFKNFKASRLSTRRTDRVTEIFRDIKDLAIAWEELIKDSLVM